MMLTFVAAACDAPSVGVLHSTGLGGFSCRWSNLLPCRDLQEEKKEEGWTCVILLFFEWSAEGLYGL